MSFIKATGFNRYINALNDIPMPLPEDSCWTKIKNAASKAFAALAEIPKMPLSSTFKSLTNLSIFVAVTAAASGVIQTVTQAGLASIFEKSLSPLSNVLQLDNYVQNAVSSLWLFIFFWGFPVIRSLAHEEEIKPPYIPNGCFEALKAGSAFGQASAIAMIPYAARNYIIAAFTAPSISSIIFTGLGIYSYYKMINYLLF